MGLLSACASARIGRIVLKRLWCISPQAGELGPISPDGTAICQDVAKRSGGFSTGAGGRALPSNWIAGSEGNCSGRCPCTGILIWACGPCRKMKVPEGGFKWAWLAPPRMFQYFYHFLLTCQGRCPAVAERKVF